MLLPLTCTLLLIAAPPLAPRPLSLREAMASATQNNFLVLRARDELAFFQAEAQERGGIFSPRLTTRVSYGTAQVLIGADPPDYVEQAVAMDLGIAGVTPIGTRYSIGLHADRLSRSRLSSAVPLNPSYRTGPTLLLAQPLLRGFGTGPNLALIEASSHAILAAAAKVDAAMMAIAAETVEKYWTWTVQQEEVRISEGLLEQAREQLRRTQLRAKAGAISPLEVSQAEATVAQRDDDLRARQRDVIQAERDLLIVAALDGQADFSWERGYRPSDVPSSSIEEVALSDVLEQVVRNRPELIQGQRAVEEQQALLRAVDDTLWPRLDLSLKVGTLGVAGDSVAGSGVSPRLTPGNLGTAAANMALGPFFEVALEGEIPIWRDTQRGSVGKAQAELTSSRAAVARRKGEVMLEARALVLQLRADGDRVEAAREAVRLAEINLDAEQRKFTGGISTTFDVLRVQGELARGKSNSIKALANLNVSMARLDRARGTLLKRHGLGK